MYEQRPSGHDIGTSFGTDNGGAIPSNLLQIPNSESGAHYISSCKAFGVKSHPARFPGKLPEFFIKMLTKPGDVVLDIFGGSNTTGEVAQKLGRRWLSCDMEPQYVAASAFRFLPKATEPVERADHPYHQILSGATVDLRNEPAGAVATLEAASPNAAEQPNPAVSASPKGQQLHFLLEEEVAYESPETLPAAPVGGSDG